MQRQAVRSIGIVVLILCMSLVIVACGGAATPAAEPVATAPDTGQADEEPAEAPSPDTSEDDAETDEPEPTEEPTEAPAEDTSEDSAEGKTFTVAWTATDPPTLDPHVCNDSGCLTLIRAMYDALLGYEYGTTDVGGVLAESWEVSDDGLSWTFTLRDDVNFSDGSAVTAEDVAYSFDRLNGIGKGPSFVVSGNYAGAEVVDEKTVVVNLEEAVGPFESMLPRVFIVNKEVVEANATDDDQWAEDWLYDHDAGSGAFVIEDWEHGVQTSIVKNENYWDSEWPKIDRAVELLVSERATDRLLLEAGDVDTVLNPDLNALSAYEANPDITVSEHESLNSMAIMMSTIVPPLDDVRVRKAVALAFDYQAMVDGVYQGHAVQAQGPLPQNMPYHDDTLPMYQQDLEQAAELLAEAGYPDGGFDLELLIVQGQPFGIGASQILQQGLAEIGVNLKITELAWSTLLGRIQSREDPGQMFVLYDFPAYPDPDAALWAKYHTSQQEAGYNGTFYGDEETDALLETGRFSNDPAEREAVYKELQQRLFEDHPAIWLVNPTWVSVRRSWVDNYEYDPTWNQTFRFDRYTLDEKP